MQSSKEILTEYSKVIDKTAQYPAENGLEYTTLGLCGEAGEVANKVKKILRDNGGEISEQRRKEIIDEMSDCMWYIGAMCKELNTSIEELIYINSVKLMDRLVRGVIKGNGDKR